MVVEEKKISSELIFEGHIMKVYKDSVSLGEEGTATREVVRHKGATAILAVDEDGNASKPFLLPQKDPSFYHKTLFTFNVPDFTKEKVDFKIKGAYKEAFSDERVQVRIKE